MYYNIVFVHYSTKTTVNKIMTTYYHNLNFNINLLKDNCIVTDLPKVVNGKKTYHSLINVKQYINPDMLKFLTELGIVVYHCELFYSQPNFVSGIHIDANATSGDFTKINWIFGGKDSIMNWYKPKAGIIRSKNPISYVGYHVDEVDVVCAASLEFPSIVQVGVPHNIINFTEDRYCVSLVLASVKNNKLYRPTMQQSLELLSKYLVPTYGIEPQSPAS